MQINLKPCKTIITKSGLPSADYVINPYIGCTHACLYCYARFMKKFTNHQNDEWGKFVNVKINAADTIPTNPKKFKDKNIVIGSVTDPYQYIEKKYKITRKILQKLVSFDCQIEIITKSDLVLRDIDLLKEFKNITVAISVSNLEENLRKKIEPFAPSYKKRVGALQTLSKNKIKTVLFCSPILPYLTDVAKIVDKTKAFVDEYWFENLNLYASIKPNLYQFLKDHDKNLIEKYNDIYFGKNNYWEIEEKKIRKLCQDEKLNSQIFFHHG
ncbi:radical SAM protein [Candidatus Beckwithbacteria bacterium]|nr:radical SAM protein [Candidatus Beckwithbacteria bacterium]